MSKDHFPDDTISELLECLRIDITCFADPEWVDEDGDAFECSLNVIESIQVKINALNAIITSRRF